MATDGVDDFALVRICLQRTTCIPSSNLGLIGVGIRRSETNLYKENASTTSRYTSNVEFEGRGIGIGVQIGKHLNYDANDWEGWGGVGGRFCGDGGVVWVPAPHGRPVALTLALSRRAGFAPKVPLLCDFWNRRAFCSKSLSRSSSRRQPRRPASRFTVAGNGPRTDWMKVGVCSPVLMTPVDAQGRMGSSAKTASGNKPAPVLRRTVPKSPSLSTAPPLRDGYASVGCRGRESQCDDSSRTRKPCSRRARLTPKRESQPWPADVWPPSAPCGGLARRRLVKSRVAEMK